MIKSKTPYIVAPEDLNFGEWSAAIVGAMNGILEPYSARDDNEWRSWAASVVSAPLLAAFNMPTPYNFQDWRSWAKAFVNSLSTAGG